MPRPAPGRPADAAHAEDDAHGETPSADTTSTARVGGPDGLPRSKSSEALEKRRSSTSSSPCATMLTNESIVPAVTAVAGATPWRWKKRMLTAIRARLDGSARFM